MNKRNKISGKVVAFLLAVAFLLNVPAQSVCAEENFGNQTIIGTAECNNTINYSYSVRPLTTLVDCEIIMAFSATEGLVMSFTTSCMDVASVIGVKDIKVQQKMWYGWKTVFTSEGAEDYNHAIFGADLVYPDAIKDKTYRVICTHYADYNGYEEVVNDTGAFKFTY